jgi:hypothetical protein
MEALFLTTKALARKLKQRVTNALLLDSRKAQPKVGPAIDLHPTAPFSTKWTFFLDKHGQLESFSKDIFKRAPTPTLSTLSLSEL